MFEQTKQFTEEEKAQWILTVYKNDEVAGVDGTESIPSPSGVKHRPKMMEVRKHSPAKRGRPRKTANPQKFTTPPQAKRTRARSQWVSSPFTEANTDEIEGVKKKPKTKV